MNTYVTGAVIKALREQKNAPSSSWRTNCTCVQKLY